MQKTVETQRLILRPWRMEDLDDFYEYAKDPDVGPWAGWKPHGSLEESREILCRWVQPDEKNLRIALELKETGKTIGSIGIEEDGHRQNMQKTRNLGYVLGKAYWGRGLMTEAVSAAIDYAFRELKLRMLSVNHYTINGRSKRVIEKSGFKYEGTLRSATAIYNGEQRDLCCYSMRAWEYWSLRARQAGYALLLPEDVERDALQNMQQSFVSTDRDVTPFGLNPHGMDFERWMQYTISFRYFVPKPAYAKATLFILCGPEGPCGALDLRHYLTERLLNGGGNIGYGIAPDFRGRKLAPYMLGLGIEKAKDMGIDRALVCADEDNPASWRTIEDCAGVMENAVDGLRRYWIAV